MHYYAETREQSAEILRLVVAFMGQQRATFHPLTYALGYEHVAGINPALTRALDDRLDAKAPLIEAEVRRLYSRYIELRDLESSEPLQAELTSLLRDTAGTLAAARTTVARYGASLQEKTGRLADTEASPISARNVLGSLLLETRTLLETMRALTTTFEARGQELNQLCEQMDASHALALVDPLTGLKNRRGLERAVDALDESHMLPDGACVIVGDVNHLKRINDSYGHFVGDKVLRAVATVLQASVKGRDIAVRLGGDEFAVFLPVTSLAGATALAEQIRGHISKLKFPLTGSDESIGDVSMSLGVATAEKSESLEELVARADDAMYEGKRAGRNRVCVDNRRRP